MGILNAIKGLFFGNMTKEKKEQIKKEIDIAEAINAHVKWKVRLQEYINGISKETLDAEMIGKDNRCVLGKWIYENGIEHFKDNKEFQELIKNHAEFHKSAGAIVKNTQMGKKDVATEIMKGEYSKKSQLVISSLTNLKSHLDD